MRTKDDIEYDFNGQRLTVDRKRIEELMRLVNQDEEKDPVEALQGAFEGTGLMTSGEAIEEEPRGPLAE